MIKFDTYHIRCGFDGETPVFEQVDDVCLLSKSQLEKYVANHVRSFFEFGFNVATWKVSATTGDQIIRMKSNETFDDLYNLYLKQKQ